MYALRVRADDPLPGIDLLMSQEKFTPLGILAHLCIVQLTTVSEFRGVTVLDATEWMSPGKR